MGFRFVFVRTIHGRVVVEEKKRWLVQNQNCLDMIWLAWNFMAWTIITLNRGPRTKDIHDVACNSNERTFLFGIE